MTGTLETINGRPALRFERRLDHPVERVWVTEPSELARWFVSSVAWAPALGETFEAGGQTGQIVELEERRVLAWTRGEEGYRFELEPEGDACLLVFTHVFDPGLGSPAQHAARWETYLNRLDSHLAGGDLSEEQAHEPIGELHERYAKSFGADPGPGRRTIARMGFRGLTLDDGPVLRLERHCGHSSSACGRPSPIRMSCATGFRPARRWRSRGASRCDCSSAPGTESS